MEHAYTNTQEVYVSTCSTTMYMLSKHLPLPAGRTAQAKQEKKVLMQFVPVVAQCSPVRQK